MDMLASFAARFTPRAHEIRLDGVVLAFTVLVSVVTGLVFGSFPAAASSERAIASLKEGGRTTASAGSRRLRTVLIVAQLAVSFVLLVGAGLMLKSLIRLQQVQPGFDAENVLTVGLDLDFTRYASVGGGTPQTILGLMEPMLERVKGEPGVVSAALAGTFPLAGAQPFTGPFLIEGREVASGRPQPQADYRIATPDYFKTVGIPLREGRSFAPTDRLGTPTVVMINESLARRFWPGEDPISRRISTDNGQHWDTIVGIVGDVKQYGLDTAPADEMYYPYLQVPLISNSLVLRTRGDPIAMLGRVRTIVRSADAELPIGKVQTLEQARSASLSPSRLTTLLLAIFAALALVIAATGIGGVIAYGVSQRTHEIGVRIALGAARNDVLRMVLREGLGMLAAGLALGAAGALALSRLMAGLLFGVEPTDPLTFVAVSALLVAVAVAASFVPARRAAGVAPMVALRTT
jgi:putative ABC transport system permease protein